MCSEGVSSERGAVSGERCGSHLAEEVEVELVLAGVELDVLDAERAAADGVGLLVGVLLVADAERQLVDEVHLLEDSGRSAW